MTRHYLFKINELNQNFDVPEMPFGKKVTLENERFKISGYFACYDQSIKSTELLNIAKTRDYAKLVNSNSEFILYILDKQNQKLKVVIDQFGRFVCYFSILKNEIYLSSGFALLKNQLKNSTQLTIDQDGLLTGIMWCWHNTERTLISEIKQVPIGSLVEFNLEQINHYKITSLVDLKTFLDESKPQQELSVEQFSKMWVDGLTQVVSDRLNQFPNQIIGCDLSSGFDCTLIAYCLAQLIPGKFGCYSRFSNLAKDETVVNLMNIFAKKHGLPLKTLDITDKQKYQENLSGLWSVDDPCQLTMTDQELFLNLISQDKISINFTGEGGDEVYQSREMDLFATFSMQQNYYFNNLHFSKLGTKAIFTDKCMDYATSESRFEERINYPVISPVMTVVPMMISEERYWEHGIWMQKPFMDTRIIGLARQIPKTVKGKKQDMKFAIMKQLKEVFPPEMFRPKGTGLATHANFLINQRPLIDSVLENSIVAKLGWIDKDNITKQLNDRNSLIYQGNVTTTFETIIQLDWFLQANNINI